MTTGCAKRPAVREVAAPAPTGAATGVPAPETAPAPVPRAAPAPAAPAAPEAATPAPVLPPIVAAPSAPPTTAAPATPARPEPTEFAAEPALRSIFFDFDKSEIRPDAAQTLDTNIEWIRSNPSALILIEGHCDERGTNAYNIALGDRRAKATRDYLMSRGVASDRITMISYGEERPVCVERDEACWAKNRRAQLLTKRR
ncbi:MAG TPA: peptidoglycan-associated lipoprotein Pal [Methylomirabilota bacterium]|nr:peptidoglycan-associated lipoprotein Pal [Methylomirabilota bacterium]